MAFEINCVLGASLCVALSCAASSDSIAKVAKENPGRPDLMPAAAMLDAPLGEWPVAEAVVSRQRAAGFGGGTIYYPAIDGRFATIAIAPGYTGYQASLAWLGPRLASHGFVVIVIDTFTTADMPEQRAKQLTAALRQMAALSADKRSPLYRKSDPDRLGVIGHSMGGGGALLVARENAGLKAALALTPWSMDKQFSATSVPTLILACELDAIAPNTNYSRPLYASLPDTVHKAYVELKGQSHFCPQAAGNYPLMGRYAIAWMKRFLDNDARYSAFLCGPEAEPNVEKVSATRSTCPF